MVFLRSITFLAKQVRVPTRPTRNFCCSALLWSSENKERRYTRKHEWIAVDGQIGTVGISNYAQEALGEVVFVQLPEVGQVLQAGDECGALESVKAASEIYSPVSGTITDKNSTVESGPSLINTSCFEKGWLFKISLSDPSEFETLMDHPAYEEFLKEQH